MVPLMYALPAFAMLVSLVIMIRSSRPRRRSRLGEAVAGIIEKTASLFRKPPAARAGMAGS